MTGPEHYREAERLLTFAAFHTADAACDSRDSERDADFLRAAQVHAMLALVAGTGRRWRRLARILLTLPALVYTVVGTVFVAMLSLAAWRWVGAFPAGVVTGVGVASVFVLDHTVRQGGGGGCG